VRLHNIGPIRDADIEFVPLTVLVGPNGSGKTTFTSVTYACWLAHAQAIESVLESIDNQLIDTDDDEAAGDRPVTRAFVDEWESEFGTRLDFELRRCSSPDLVALGRARRGGQGAGPRIEIASARWCLPFRLEGDVLRLERDSASYKRARLRWPKAGGAREFRARVRATLGADLPGRAIYFPAGRSGFVQTHTAISGLVLSALSGGYFQDATLGAIPGATADFMRLVAQVSTKGRTRNTGSVARDIEEQLLHGHLRLEDAHGARRFLFQPEGQTMEWPLQNMATAVAEFAALVLYLRHVARPGDAVLIDEPESHLHPSSQVPLAEALQAVAQVCPPLVVATHSELLVTAMSTMLLRARAEGREPPELRVYAFTFHDEDRGLGVDVWPLEVDPEEGFAVDQFAEVVNAAYAEAVTYYNAAHDPDHVAG